jgi:hypothetical protein
MCNLCLQIKTPHAELVFLFLSKPPLHPRHCRILPLGPLPFLPSDELADGERAAGGGGGGARSRSTFSLLLCVISLVVAFEP